jgi:WD40 repeat protein
VVYCYQHCQLHLCSINGRHLCTEDTQGERLSALIFSRDGRYLVTGGNRQCVTVRNTHDLRIFHRFDKLGRDKSDKSCSSGAEIRSLATTSNEQHLLVGLQTGELEVFALNEDSLRKMFVDSLDELGF